MSGSFGPLKGVGERDRPGMAGGRSRSAAVPRARALALPHGVTRHRAPLGWGALAGAALLSVLAMVMLGALQPREHGSAGAPAGVFGLRAGPTHRGPSSAHRGPSSAHRGPSSAHLPGLASLPAAARGPVSAALGAGNPAYQVSPATGGFQAASGPQRLRLRFDRAGAQIASGALHVTVAPATLGGGHRQALMGVAPHADANRVTYVRGPVSEWYVNGPLGLEQGFTIGRPPAGERSAAQLALSMTVSGNAHASVSAGAQSITFAAPGASSLRYYDLTATDATGRTLHSWLTLSAGAVLVHVDTAGARYPLTIDPLISLNEQLTGAGELGAGRFGASVALSGDGDTALVGAPRDNNAAGAAWVFVRSGSTWVEQEKLVEEEAGPEFSEEQCAQEPEEPEEPGSECGFGASVALSADGDTALVGAPRGERQTGAAWVFTRTGSVWSKEGARLAAGVEKKARKARFGRSVALSADGATALVGAPNYADGYGAAWAFVSTASGWKQQGEKLVAPGESGETRFGHGVALSADGSTALIGAPATDEHIGAAWTFDRSGEGAGAEWNEGQELSAEREGTNAEEGEGRFGFSVALSGAGDTALVGARYDAEGDGAAWAFNREGAFWGSGEKLTGPRPLESKSTPEEFGFGVALSGEGNVALIGAPRAAGHSGAAWVFSASHAGWKRQSLEAPEESQAGWFGSSGALSAEGTTALVGVPRDHGQVGSVWASQPGVTPPPVVRNVAPKSGPSAGGTVVTVKGSGFLPGATVNIGTPASSVEVVSETEIHATTSETPPGEYEVVVGDGNGFSSGGPKYTYTAPPPPEVTSVSPASGPSSGGTKVTIKGSGFLAGAAVDIGSAARSVEVVSKTKIVAVTGASSPGTDEVVVSDANGNSSGGPGFTYEAPPSSAGSPNTATDNTSSVVNPTAHSGVLGNTAISLPLPQLERTANLTAFSGTVLVKLPGSSTFVALSSIRQIPFGTIIDATHGSVTITTVLPNGTTQTITLYAGEFMLTQQRNGTVLVTLEGGSFSVCPTAKERSHLARTSSTHTSASHVVRKLWANGHGKYTTKGNYASGAVQGTVWLTEDLCDGTSIAVTRDSVLVTNLVTHKHFLVKAGHHYLAKAP